MRHPLKLIPIGLIALLGWSQAAPPFALAAQDLPGLWYESYRDGLEAWKSEDWLRAERSLKDALAKRPEQGRNIPVPGRRIDYLPEFYLGLIHVRQQRYREASDLLEKVRATLVGQRDPEFEALLKAIDDSRRGNLESFKRRTVKIDAVRADGTPETGTGIIVGRDAGGVFVLTALHVLMERDGRNEAPQSVDVRFFVHEDAPLIGPYRADPLGNRFDTGVDLAAVRVGVSPEVLRNATRWEYRDTPFVRQERVFTVGHAVTDHGVSETNVVLNPVDPDPSHFVISAAGIGERSSGGPVIDSRGYLAGLMVLLDPRAGRVVAVQVRDIRFWLQRWGIVGIESSHVR